MDVGFMGPTTWCQQPVLAVNYSINAAQHIHRGDADIMIAGSADAAVILAGVETASKPLVKGRDGFVMGEGAGALILEEYEHAMARCVCSPIIARYISGGLLYTCDAYTFLGPTPWILREKCKCPILSGTYTCDAYHMTNPDPEGKGVKLCLNKALEAAGISASDVNYVNAHGTSTPAGDMAEYRALLEIFPQESFVNEHRPPKSMIGHLLGGSGAVEAIATLMAMKTATKIGHLLGGSGAVEAIATLMAMKTGWVHPTLNLNDPEDGVDPIRCVAGVKQELDVNVALSNSFGFGGHNSSIIFKKL
eukprot:gene21399-28357_t